MRHTVFSILSRGHFRPVFETWQYPIIVYLKYNCRVGNKNQLGNFIIHSEASIFRWKLHFQLGNITSNLDFFLV